MQSVSTQGQIDRVCFNLNSSFNIVPHPCSFASLAILACLLVVLTGFVDARQALVLISGTFSSTYYEV
jgi:hypothetical protein